MVTEKCATFVALIFKYDVKQPNMTVMLSFRFCCCNWQTTGDRHV